MSAKLICSVLVVVLLGACSAPTILSPAATAIRVPTAPESVALEAFKQFADTQKLPYKPDRVSVETLNNDGTYANVRITAWFRPTAQSEWIEQFADIEVRNVGGKWYASNMMYFQDTASTQQTKVAIANATVTSVSATQVSAQATYDASRRATETARSVQATATTAAMQTATSISASATRTAESRITDEITKVVNAFFDAAKRRDCDAQWGFFSTKFQQELTMFGNTKEAYCRYSVAWGQRVELESFSISEVLFRYISNNNVDVNLQMTVLNPDCKPPQQTQPYFIRFNGDDGSWKIIAHSGYLSSCRY